MPAVALVNDSPSVLAINQGRSLSLSLLVIKQVVSLCWQLTTVALSLLLTNHSRSLWY